MYVVSLGKLSVNTDVPLCKGSQGNPNLEGIYLQIHFGNLPIFDGFAWSHCHCFSWFGSLFICYWMIISKLYITYYFM